MQIKFAARPAERAAPYLDDMDDIAERLARDPETSKTYTVPGNMTYKQWAAKQTGLAKSVKPLEKSVKSGIMPISDLIENAIGVKKGTPINVVEAVSGANPGCSKGGAYRVNCQRCVQTYEFRRRGYDVVAKPKPQVKDDIIIWGSECFVGQNNAVVEYTFNQTAAQVKREIKNAPDGARYGIYIKWKGVKSAHVFVAEKVDGVVRFLDPQSGKLDVSSYFDRGSAGKFGFFRMDDKQPTTDAKIVSATMEGLK